MNILIFNWRDPKNPKSGGAEIVTLQHAKAWIKKGHTVTWFAAGYHTAPKQEIFNKITIIRRGNMYTVFFFAPFYYLSTSKKFDYVIDQIHGLPFFTPIYVRKTKIIAFIHEVAGEIWDHMYSFPVNSLGKLFERICLLLYRSIRFWAVSPSAAAELVSYGIPQKNIAIILSPVMNATLTKLPTKEKEFTCISVSRLVKMKGVEDVVRAFYLIRKKEPKASLRIIGNGSSVYMTYLKKEIKKYNMENNVMFYGYINEKKKLLLLKKSHIFLNASVKEGWGLSVLEAASQATPSVVYNVAGLRDSVKDGKTGCIVKDNTPESLAQNALSLYNDKKRYQQLQKNGLKWINDLTWKQATEQSLQFFTNNEKK